MLMRKTVSVDANVQKSRSFWQDVWARFWKNKKAIMGMVLLGIIILGCMYGLFFVDYGIRWLRKTSKTSLQARRSSICSGGTDSFAATSSPASCTARVIP